MAVKTVCPSKSVSKHGYFGIFGCSVYCYFAQSRASVGIAINTKEKPESAKLKVLQTKKIFLFYVDFMSF